MSSVEGSFSFDSKMIYAAVVEGIGTGAGTGIGFGQVGSEQGLFGGEGLTVMDSDRCLRCLS